MLYPSVAMQRLSSRQILDGDPHASGRCPVRQQSWLLFRSTSDWTAVWQSPVRQVAGNDNDIIMKCALLPGQSVFIVVIALTDPVNPDALRCACTQYLSAVPSTF